MTEGLIHREEFSQLMADLASGSEDAAWRIAEIYTPHILRAVRAMLPAAIRPKIDSQDFAQIVWASLLLKRTYLAHISSPEQLIRLLAGTAQHKVIDVYRRYTTHKGRDLKRETPLAEVLNPRRKNAATQYDRGVLDRDLSPSQFASVREKWQSLANVLSPRDRDVLRLRYEGRTYVEIAGTLGIGVTTVRRVLDRIIERLQA